MARRKKRKKCTAYKRASYRNAPMPAWFNTVPWGTCRWCNQPILRANGEVNPKRHWHPECLHPYFLLTRQSYAKREVKKRDKGMCKDCGKKCTLRNEWHLDHDKPLIDANGDLWYWTLDNLVTRCVACHKRKTISENAQRRAKKLDSA